MVSLYDHRWFIGGGGRFLRLHGRVKVAVSQFSPLEMVAMEYFWVHFATDKLDIATSMRPRCSTNKYLMETILKFLKPNDSDSCYMYHYIKWWLVLLLTYNYLRRRNIEPNRKWLLFSVALCGRLGRLRFTQQGSYFYLKYQRRDNIYCK